MISYIGGKSKIGKWIVNYYPNEIETYVEGFGGMFWCFYNMDLDKFKNLKRVVYNDFNPLNSNLFKCLENPSELLRAMDSIPCQEYGVDNTPELHKIIFQNYQQYLFSGNLSITSPDYMLAAQYVYVVTQVFSGSKPETSSFIDLKGKYKSKFLTFKDKLSKPSWLNHFLKISEVENLDFEALLAKYDSPTTYFYMDPPYWKTENYYSKHDFDDKDHERLSNVLKGLQGKFSLSYYDFDLLHEWFPQDQYRWEKKEFSKAASATKGKSQNKGEELLIMNYG